MIREYSTYPLSRRQLLIFCVIAAAILGSCVYLFYNSIVISLLYCGLAYPASRYYSKYLAEKRRRELSYQFRDLLYAISSSISAGRRMREALIEAENSMKLIHGENACISRELKYMIDRMEESGETEEVVLRDFALRSGVADIKAFRYLLHLQKNRRRYGKGHSEDSGHIAGSNRIGKRSAHIYRAKANGVHNSDRHASFRTYLPQADIRVLSGNNVRNSCRKNFNDHGALFIGAAAVLGARITRISL